MPALTLDRLTTGEVQALTRIARHGVALGLNEWPHGDDVPDVTLVPCAPAADTPLADDAVRFALDWAGARLHLDLPRTACATWLRAQVPNVVFAELPAHWQQALYQQASGWLCAVLSQSGRGLAQCTAVSRAGRTRPPGSRHRLLMTLRFPGSGDALYGVLHADGLGILLVAGLIPDAATVAPAAVETAQLPVALRVAIGDTDLPAARYARLRRGDVVLVARPLLGPENTLVLTAEAGAGARLGFRARLDGTTLTLLEAPIAMSAPAMPEPPADDDTPVGLDQLPVRLTFDLGDKVLTYGELAQLQPGETLELARPATDYVTVRANGAVIGHGHLVEVDGRLGVRLASLGRGGQD